MGHDPTVQEPIPVGEECIIGALYDRGDALAVLQHRQVRGTSYVGSGGAYRESVAVPGLESAVRDPLDELDWHGLACIEYIGDADTGEFVWLRSTRGCGSRSRERSPSKRTSPRLLATGDELPGRGRPGLRNGSGLSLALGPSCSTH